MHDLRLRNLCCAGEADEGRKMRMRGVRGGQQNLMDGKPRVTKSSPKQWEIQMETVSIIIKYVNKLGEPIWKSPKE